MSLQVTAAIYRKEMLELFRDRRTLLSMVIAPLLIVPLLLLALSAFRNLQTKQAQQATITAGVASAKAVEDLSTALKSHGVQLIATADLRKAVESNQVSIAIQANKKQDGRFEYTLFEDRLRQASSVAAIKVRSFLEGHRSDVVRRSLEAAGMPERTLTPFAIKTVNVASEERIGNFILGTSANYILLFFMFIGATYPAIDTAAGEKERRTFELLLCSPVSRAGLLLGKVCACATASWLTGILALFGFVLATSRGVPYTGGTVLRFHVDLSTAVLAMLGLIPIALIAASAMVACSLLAKSFKEGQSYLMPLMMVFTSATMLGTVLNLKLDAQLCLIPVLNTTLVLKQLFQGSYFTYHYFLSMAVNLVYAGIPFLVALRLLRSERVLLRT